MLRSLVFSLLFSFCALASSAQGIINTIAGGGNGGDGAVATQAALDMVNDVLVDTSGNVYIAQETAIRKIDANTQVISLYAGCYAPGIGCDSCAANTAKLSHANAIAFDKQGDLYIADWGSCRVRRVDRITGIMTTYAGNGTIGYSGDGGPAKNAQLRKPMDIAFDANDNLYIADANFHIRRVDRQTGIITTIAGDGTQGTWSNGDTANKVRFGAIAGVCVDKMDNLYFADAHNRKIGKLNAQGVLSTYCGTGVWGVNGDGGLAINAETFSSAKIRLDKNENMYIADGYIRRIDKSSGIIERVAGIYGGGFSGDGGPALQATLNNPVSAFPDVKNNLYIADQLNFRIRKVSNIVRLYQIPVPIDLVLYPNPSNGLFFIKCSQTIGKVEIRNILGELIYSSQPQDNYIQISIASQPSGVYLVSVFGKDGMVNKKLVVSH